MLTIKNIQTIIGQQYNEVFNVIGVQEHKQYYEFTLGYASIGPNKTETILLHRKQTSNGMYIMEYNSKTMWVNKSQFDTLDKIIECMQKV